MRKYSFTISDENADKLHEHMQALRDVAENLTEYDKDRLGDEVQWIAELSYCKPDSWILDRLYRLILCANDLLFDNRFKLNY